MSPDLSAWPALPYDAWSDTYHTLHLWTQVVGKVRLVQTQWLNHSWHVTLYVTARGLSTSPIPHGTRTFGIEFDFVGHRLTIETSDGGIRHLPLEPAIGRHVLLAPDGRDGGARPAGAHPYHAQRDRRWDPLRPRRDAPFVRSRVCRPLLAGSGPGRSGPENLSIALPRQVQSGAFFLGRRRPGGHALFGSARPGAPGRRAESAGLGRA